MSFRNPSRPAMGGCQIRAYIVDSNNFVECPHCQELTVTQTKKIVKEPTHYSCGTSLTIDECHSCSYYRELQERIPSIPYSPPVSNDSIGIISPINFGGFISESDDSNWNVDNGSSDFDDDSGSGDFGGGDSGGGGAGNEW